MISMRLVFHGSPLGLPRTLKTFTAIPQVATYASQRVPHGFVLGKSVVLPVLNVAMGVVVWKLQARMVMTSRRRCHRLRGQMQVR